MTQAPHSLDSATGSSPVTSSSGAQELVFVSRLMMTDFRSYQQCHLNLACQQPLVVLTGDNGAGKTNVLEAVSYAAPGRGLRGANIADVGRIGGGPWSVALSLELKADDLVEPVKVGTGQDPVRAANDAGEDGQKQAQRRVVRIDGENKPNTSALGDRWSVSWLTPQMDRLFIEGPSSRRRFLDRLVLGLFPDHSRQVSAFERAMRDRNRLLSEQGLAADSAWLTALEARMAEHAVAVAVARLEFAGQIAGQIADAPASPFPKAELALDGWLENQLADGIQAVDAEAAYADRLANERALDARAGRTSTGVHKTDFIVTHSAKNMRADLCSTGEQKALLIGLILANARLQIALKGQAPLMLMDEVAAHLDSDRRAALFEELAALGSQCWLTGTDRSLFKSLMGKAEFFEVAHGVIQPCAV
ncbi:MAG: DNA replication/repair protein RecF [Kordiimonadaceae bacterium]|nr:DNA replication/repair protein RecF [Kordiimonadaceae bacterium]MBO6568749.1 DNA replication/repair protein RecF [Kordiimonadaceae bacterium]MBO6965275.1 DNA replication/repair protein RecF [Kordiimonadaceae bacterium]